MKFDHVHIAAMDLDRSVEFYRDRLGFNLGYRDDSMAEFDESLVLDKETTGSTAATVAFRVDDVDAMHTRLTADGVKVDGPPEDQYEESAISICATPTATSSSSSNRSKKSRPTRS